MPLCGLLEFVVVIGGRSSLIAVCMFCLDRCSRSGMDVGCSWVSEALGELLFTKRRLRTRVCACVGTCLPVVLRITWPKQFIVRVGRILSRFFFLCWDDRRDLL